MLQGVLIVYFSSSYFIDCEDQTEQGSVAHLGIGHKESQILCNEGSRGMNWVFGVTMIALHAHISPLEHS